jgi:hypothetical protein
MGETRKQLKERLQRTGLWQPFLGLREQLKREGRTREPSMWTESRKTQPEKSRHPQLFTISQIRSRGLVLVPNYRIC